MFGVADLMKGLDHFQSSNLRSRLMQRSDSRGPIKSLQQSQDERQDGYRAWSSNSEDQGLVML